MNDFVLLNVQACNFFLQSHAVCLLCISIFILSNSPWPTLANPWGTDECGPPNHSGGFSGSSGGLSLVMDSSNSIILSSSTSFKGFFLQADSGLSFSNPSTNSGVRDVCSIPGSVVTHTNSVRRTMTKATISCSSNVGQSFSLTAYVVYGYSSSYDSIHKSFVCSEPAAGTSPDIGSGVGQTSGQTGQVDSMGFITVEWTPSILADSKSISGKGLSTSYSDVQVILNTLDQTTGWVGIGFGTNDYKMTGGKKSIVLSKTNSGCSVDFYTMQANSLVPVTGGGSFDPWNISPNCSVLSPNLASMSFRLGGSSQLSLPPQGTTLFVLLAGGVGVPVGNHGSNWDYKQVDFLSASTEDSGSEGPVNPYFLAHGIIFITTFAILMPLTAFLILINRAKYFNIHKYLGVLIVCLLIAGWVLINPGGAADESGDYAGFSDSPIGSTHADFGGIGCWVAVGVCALGVVLWFIKLPRTMKTAVRYTHGIVGIGLSFFGPYVVWTGWAQLDPPLVPKFDYLDESPLIWLSLAIILGTVYLFFEVKSRLSRASTSPSNERVISQKEIDGMIENGKLILLFDGSVFEVPKTFTHPGGRDVLEALNGKDIGQVMRGIESFQVRNRTRVYGHSDEALKQALTMKIGVASNLSPTTTEEHDASETAKSYSATIVSMNIVNTARDFPVRLFEFRLEEPTAIVIGSKVFMSIDNITRPYTVCKSSIDGKTFEMCIKIYPQGQLTNRLNQMKVGQTVSLSRPSMHPPISSAASPPILAVFLAGGTGITPMIGYLQQCSQLALGGYLFWWVRHEGDVFLMSDLEDWGRKFNVQILVFYTQPLGTTEAVAKKTGRVCAKAILDAFGGSLPVQADQISWVFSGPQGFAGATDETLRELGARSERIVALD